MLYCRIGAALLCAAISVPGIACTKQDSTATLPTTSTEAGNAFPNVDGRQPLAIVPADLLSDVGFTPIVITVSGGLIAADTLPTLAASTQLRTYPELTAVAITTKIHVGDPVPTGQFPKDAAPQAPLDYGSYITVLPVQPLDPARWYVLTVSKVAGNVLPPSSAPITKEGLQYASRFKLGSGPVIKRVEAYQTGHTIVEFSEGVAVNAGTLTKFVLARNPDLSACAYAAPTGNVPTPAQGGVTFECGTEVTAQKRLTLDLNAGLFSLSNEPLTILDPAAQTAGALTKPVSSFVVPLSRSCGGDCLFWAP